jgi:hypothetical protein
VAVYYIGYFSSVAVVVAEDLVVVPLAAARGAVLVDLVVSEVARVVVEGHHVAFKVFTLMCRLFI